ncbi:amidohydrolase [Galbibacter orientalis]|uniref:Putative TIM-barrel fold metal-dependent hydrolase n=1 Tax=Galbibacter orientalis DSM 19592 TaxID=926559 RepID=I3C684_9FLAO|nr:amidohydrolase [Galbibacter orientalis]EIJ39127.1 putative TIM-barrel fold metal-dependent hydrolase [Galbibacter orientalis DSM 19592]
MRNIFFVGIILMLVSCGQKEKVALVVINANVYTVDSLMSNVEAFAVKDEKFVAVGTSDEITKKYTSEKIIDLKGKPVYPGFIDAHCHFYGLGLQEQNVDLVGTQSYEEVIQRVVDFQKKRNTDFIVGRGWDQNDWEEKEFPTKEALDSLYPNTPVVLSRIDGHAYLVNQKALDLAGITPETKVDGGEIVLQDGELTGVLVDNPMGLIDAVFPETTPEVATKALEDAQKICFDYGLTTVNDAGLSKETILLIDSLQKAGVLDMRIYAMVSNTPENLDYFLDRGVLKTDKLDVRSVKAYADGALGSRGAALKAPYSDKHNHFGAMVTPVDQIYSLAERLAETDYQLNTHAIGDSANVVVLRAYEKALQGKKDKRWKVEHAQIVAVNDFDYFSNNIIPSVQPTHATSDMYWAEDRVGAQRIKGAYAYKTLLEKAGVIALGTDFPVEHVSPFLTFYAAVARKDIKGYPENGFQTKDALSREETLRGMTIWAAYSNFEENEKGSIEAGKWADFIVLDKDIMRVPESEIPNLKVEATYVGGKQVK